MKTFKTLLITLTMLTLASCASLDKLPTKGNYYSIAVEGRGEILDASKKAFSKAKDLCPVGYDIVDTDAKIVVQQEREYTHIKLYRYTYFYLDITCL